MDIMVSSEHFEDDALEPTYEWKMPHPSLYDSSLARGTFSDWLEGSDSSEAWVRSSDEFGGGGSAYHAGLSKISELLRESLIDDVIFTRAVEMMKYLFTSRTIFSSIAPDDGDLVFYWKAGCLSIEIDLLSDGGAWWSVDGLDAYEFTGDGPELPLVELKHYLNIFSKEVDTINPNWRSLQTW